MLRLYKTSLQELIQQKVHKWLNIDSVQKYLQAEDVPLCYWTSLYVMYLPAVSLGLMIFTTWKSSRF